ncbi:hypothetical protein [Nitratireductor sp. XY-223]|nr:hypothetical protein [Nitratireductor sp. XY-223]
MKKSYEAPKITRRGSLAESGLVDKKPVFSGVPLPPIFDPAE